ncbi:MAG: hypothetical protein AAGF01_21925 [Cyanobacteria bacterium P01_G01_bin.38]
MEALITAALLLAGTPEQPYEAAQEPIPDSIDVTPENLPAETSPSESAVSQVTCPPGQFASAFSDVYPTDWAYEAVNRLAGVAIECFDLPEPRS